jgi:hypothetical protein
MALPEAARQNLWPWSTYNVMDKTLTASGGVAFFANSAPGFTMPFAGQDFRRSVVVLPPYVPASQLTGPPTPRAWRAGWGESQDQVATAQSRPVAAQMRALGAAYLFVQAGTPAYQGLAAVTPAQLHRVFYAP